MAITASMVKELRGATGAGMMDAKKALTETDGDFESAVDWLRTKGLAKAAKKSGRVAAEGLVAVAVDGSTGVVVEVNSETDFVAKNADFQEMVGSFATSGLSVESVEELADSTVAEGTISDVLASKIATIGENMSLRRMGKISGGAIESYVHNAAAPGMGKIGVLVALSSENPAFGKQVAMHIAATHPQSLSEVDLDPELVEREKNVLTDQARESGKPEAVIEKMIEGRMKKFMGEVTLLGQSFVINPEVTVAQAAKEAGVEITAYLRFEVGEGMEKREEDFAAEVAKAAGN